MIYFCHDDLYLSLQTVQIRMKSRMISVYSDIRWDSTKGGIKKSCYLQHHYELIVITSITKLRSKEDEKKNGRGRLQGTKLNVYNINII